MLKALTLARMILEDAVISIEPPDTLELRLSLQEKRGWPSLLLWAAKKGSSEVLVGFKVEAHDIGTSGHLNFTMFDRHQVQKLSLSSANDLKDVELTIRQLLNCLLGNLGSRGPAGRSSRDGNNSAAWSAPSNKPLTTTAEGFAEDHA